VGWETQRTTALPELPAHGNGRHRRRRRLGGLATAGVLLTIGVTGAMLSPVLIGWTGPLVPPAARASAVVPPTAPAQSDPMANAPVTTAPPPPTAPPLTASALPTATKATAYAYAGFEDKVLALTNEQRGKQGCPALRRDAKLVKAARAHSKDMAAHKYFDHTGLDKSSPGIRMDRAGYDADSGWAENIAYGFPTPEAVMNKWMNSPGHRQNILDCGLKALGVGVAKAADNSLYWTQDFGRV
jgi:uncharacterized protein YkwD